MLEAKVTNQAKFSKVSDVDFSGASRSIFRGQFDGNVMIQFTDGHEQEWDGEFGVTDFEEDYGFIVVEA